jgi:arylsulfatase B
MLITDSQRVRDPIKWRKSAVMSEQWRLINGKELFNIDEDKGQNKDVSKAHPEVTKRMRDFYEAWWKELEPTFAQTTEIYLGHPDAQHVRLTSHDWIADSTTPWNQAHIRSAEKKPSGYGFWAVKVIEPGDYKVELRRWPNVIDHPIAASLPPGEDVPGETAFRARPGIAFPAVKASLKVGGKEQVVALKKGATHATFNVTLEKGTDELWGKFIAADGDSMGSFYAYVTKL